MTKMNYLHLQRPEEAIKTYRELLGYTKVGGHSPEDVSCYWSVLCRKARPSDELTSRVMSRAIMPKRASTIFLTMSAEKERLVSFQILTVSFKQG
jgi:hypothetical protein